MNKAFDFYFDFISPYSYIAHKEIRKLEKTKTANILSPSQAPILQI